MTDLYDYGFSNPIYRMNRYKNQNGDKNMEYKKIQPTQTKTNQPLKKFRAGRITATIWESVIQKDKEQITVYNTSIEKNYKDKEDKWQTTSSFNITDLPKVNLVCDEAFKFLTLKVQEKED